MKGFTRRNLPGVVAGAGLALKAGTLNAQAPLSGADLYNKAREGKRAAAEELAKFELPMATEPAFQFKA